MADGGQRKNSTKPQLKHSVHRGFCYHQQLHQSSSALITDVGAAQKQPLLRTPAKPCCPPLLLLRMGVVTASNNYQQRRARTRLQLLPQHTRCRCREPSASTTTTAAALSLLLP